MRVLLLTLALAACSKSPKAPPAPAAPLVQAMHDLADRACACGDARDCLKAVRVDFDAQKATLVPNAGFTQADTDALGADRQRLRMCGDAGGLTMWN
jgi:hypothetical protein